MKKIILTALLVASSSIAFADNVIATDTTTWKSVPIVVDTTKQMYTVQGTVPESGDYYYTYTGYRCLTMKKDVEGTTPIVYHSAVANGTDIYCYPE